MFKKRLLAYIIDILVLSSILSFISFFIPTSQSLTNLDNAFIDVNNSFINGVIDIKTYLNQYAGIIYSMDREMFLFTLISVFVSICYFVLVPLYNNGQSIGKKICSISVVSLDNSVSANGLLLRYLMIDSIGVSILSLCAIFVIRDVYYLIFVGILSFLQFLVVIISVFMILYRRDGKSLPDIFSGTKVIEVEK